MKKVYIVLFTVLVILSAFLIVQAQNDNQGSKVTEAVVSEQPTTAPAAVEKKDESVQNTVGESNPESEINTEPEETEESEQQIDPELKATEELEPEKTEEPEQEISPEPTDNPQTPNEPEPTVVSEGNDTVKPTETTTESGEITEEPTPTAITELTSEQETTVVPTQTQIPEATAELTEKPVDEHIYDEVVVSIKGAQVSVTYDGQRHQASGYTVTGISNEAYQASDFIFTGSASAELYDAGIAYMGLNDGMFVNKNNKFVNVYFDIEDGFVEIYPINVEIEVIGNSETVEFDGETHSVYGYEYKQIRPETPQIVTAESFGLKDGKEPFVENDKVGIFGMGLNNTSFENYNPNFNRVLFNVTDGFIEITPSEKLIVEEELLDEEVLEEGLTEEPVIEGGKEPEAAEVVSNPDEIKTEGQEVTGDQKVADDQKIEQTNEINAGENETVFAAGTVIYSAPDQNSEVFTSVSEGTALVILGTTESGWTEVQIDGGVIGYIAGSAVSEPEKEEKIPETDDKQPVSEDNDVKDETVSDDNEVPENEVQENTVSLTAGTVIYAAPDETSEILQTLDADTEFTVVSTDENGWMSVRMGDEAEGYIPAAAEQQEESEDKPVEETEEINVIDDSVVSFTAGTVIYAAPDETSEILQTLDADTEFTVVSTDENGWMRVRLGDEAEGYIPAAAEQQEESEDKPTEETEEEIVVTANTFTSFAAGTVIYSAADEASDILLTLEEDTELFVLNADEAGWVTVQLNDEATGYIHLTVEPEGAEEEQQDKLRIFIAGTVFYEAPDETSNIVMTLTEDTELTILKIDEFGWAEVQLSDNLTGYVFVPEYAQNEEDDEYTQLLPAGAVIRISADGMSDIIYTAAEDIYVKVLNADDVDWIQVETKDGIVGFVFHSDIPLEGKLDEENSEPTAKVLIFTSRRAIMDLGEEIKLTSVLEGMPEDITINYQWECDKGEGFEPVEDGTSDSYSYEATVESLAWSWRLVVTY